MIFGKLGLWKFGRKNKLDESDKLTKMEFSCREIARPSPNEVRKPKKTQLLQKLWNFIFNASFALMMIEVYNLECNLLFEDNFFHNRDFKISRKNKSRSPWFWRFSTRNLFWIFISRSTGFCTRGPVLRISGFPRLFDLKVKNPDPDFRDPEKIWYLRVKQLFSFRKITVLTV